MKEMLNEKPIAKEPLVEKVEKKPKKKKVKNLADLKDVAKSFLPKNPSGN